MTEAQQVRIVGYVMLAILLGGLLLILYGISSSYADCENQGGAYVRTANGYVCLEEGETDGP